jgi:hypothetical protein
MLADDAAGLDAGLTTVHAVLQNHEGALDRIAFVAAFTVDPDFDPSPYVDTPTVTQPTLDDGTVPVPGGEVALLGINAEPWLYRVESNGAWTAQVDPDVFFPPGNGYRVVVNASGSAADGTVFLWVDDDPEVRRRVSFAWPASESGRWVRRSPVAMSSATPQPLGTAAAGTSPDAARADHVHPIPTAEELRAILGSDVIARRGSGSVVTTTTTPSTLLPTSVTLPTLAVGDVATIDAGGSYLNNSGSGKVLVVTLDLGGQTVAFQPSNPTTNATARSWSLNAAVHIVSSSEVRVTGQFVVGTVGGAAGSSPGAATATLAVDVVTSGATLDLIGAVASGGSQELQMTTLTVTRRRA